MENVTRPECEWYGRDHRYAKKDGKVLCIYCSKPKPKRKGRR